ncbi:MULTISPECIES: phosphatase PAP2 family protein [unclassified Streptomyces]|uniref:phosphatase PAP2 family protein n=1 Tax=unclassified Streptomyces TaxID=2593676 RepID=UPI004042F161
MSGPAPGRRPRPAWPAAGALCVVPTAMVVVERVQSGAHHPSDVAAGAVIGRLASAWLGRRRGGDRARWRGGARGRRG